MRKNISESKYVSYACVVDEELLNSINAAYKMHCPNCLVFVKVLTSDHAIYSFDSVEELFEYADTWMLDIDSIEIRFNEKEVTNCFEIKFKNMVTFASERIAISYSFVDEGKYTGISKQVDSLLRSKRAGYSILTRLPLVPCITVAVFCAICLYTWSFEILFPQWVQIVIWAMLFIGCGSFVLPISQKIKRKLFPLVDFRIGIMRRANEKKSVIRDRVFWGVIIALIVGVVAGIIASRFS